jgi:hypothetical protein
LLHFSLLCEKSGCGCGISKKLKYFFILIFRYKSKNFIASKAITILQLYKMNSINNNNNIFNFNFDVNNGVIAPDNYLVNNKFSNVQEYIQFINGSFTNPNLLISHTNFPVYDEAVELDDETDIDSAATAAALAHCPCCPLFNEAIKTLHLDRLSELEEGVYHLDKRAKTCDFASATVASSFAYLFAPSAASHESDYATPPDDASASALDALIAQTENLSINIDIDLNNINNEEDEDLLFNEYCELNWEEFVARSAEFAALNYNRSSPVIPMTYVPSNERMQRYLH